MSISVVLIKTIITIFVFIMPHSPWSPSSSPYIHHAILVVDNVPLLRCPVSRLRTQRLLNCDRAYNLQLIDMSLFMRTPYNLYQIIRIIIWIKHAHHMTPSPLQGGLLFATENGFGTSHFVSPPPPPAKKIVLNFFFIILMANITIIITGNHSIRGHLSQARAENRLLVWCISVKCVKGAHQPNLT